MSPKQGRISKGNESSSSSNDSFSGDIRLLSGYLIYHISISDSSENGVSRPWKKTLPNKFSNHNEGDVDNHDDGEL